MIPGPTKTSRRTIHIERYPARLVAMLTVETTMLAGLCEEHSVKPSDDDDTRATVRVRAPL